MRKNLPVRSTRKIGSIGAHTVSRRIERQGFSMEIASSRATLTVTATETLLCAATARAREIGARVHIAIMDSAADLVGWISFDGAPRIAAHTARCKAFTAVNTGMSTREWGEYVDGIPPSEQRIIHGIEGYIGADGGYPIVHAGNLLGGIGVSGASQEIDADCARAALLAIGVTVG